MQHATKLSVVGGDSRQGILAELLRSDGHDVAVCALERYCFSSDLRILDGLHFEDFPAIILPMPLQNNEGRLNTPLSNTRFMLTDVLDSILSETLVLAGKVSFSAHAQAVRNKIKLIDYLEREEFAVRNAVPTAEGAIQIAMEETAFTLQGARVLVIGHGHIGSLLAQKLACLRAIVTVSARKAKDFAKIEANGLRYADTRVLTEILSRFDLIFNTVPAAVFGAAELAAIRPDTLVIDLASSPGGIDPTALRPSELRYIHALSLPGKVAPISAACAVRDTVYSILIEEGIL